MNDSGIQTAQILLETHAVQLSIEKPFTFASGIKSPIYCDNRLLLGFTPARDFIVDLFLKEQQIQEAEVIAGTSTAGIAWAAFIADRLKKPMAYVRAEEKKHGTGKNIEGSCIKNRKTVIIEDLISTGKSSKKVLDILLQNQADVIGISAIFSYEFEESKTIFGMIPCKTLSNFSTLLMTAQKHKILTEEECSIAGKWNQNPHAWNN